MGVIELNGIFKAKNKTAAQWASENPILRDGEFGHEKDTHKSKIGDGVNHWNDLEYANKAYPADIKMTDWAKMLESAYSPITNTDTLLAALQKLQVLIENGDGYVFRCYDSNSNTIGVAFGSSDGARGLRAICYHNTSNKLMICSGTVTLPAFIRMSEADQSTWLREHIEHSITITDNSGGVSVVEITDFAIPSVNITKDGQSFFFYANDATNIPNSNHGATSFVGVAIASPIYITGDQRLLYYMMVDTARGMFYTGRANIADDTVAWNTTPITRLGQAVQVTAFTEGALSALLYSYKPGDFIPFYTGNVTASTTNQFPESGIFNGFISMGSNEGDYFQIFAFRSGSTKAYLGACIGSTTQWTALGGGGGMEVIQITAGEDVADSSKYNFTEEGQIFPIYINSQATNAPEGGYNCVGTIQCNYFVASGSWEATLIVNPAENETGIEAYQYIAKFNAETNTFDSWVKMGGSSGSSLPFDGPIPGYELVYSNTSAVLQLASGTEVMINFDKAIPAAQMFTSKARFMIEADIVSVSGNTLSNVARVPIAIFKPTAAGQPVFEYMIQSIATGTNIGRVRLIITSWIREAGSTGDITGCNLMAQVNNLNPSMNYALTFPGMYVKSSGGGQ